MFIDNKIYLIFKSNQLELIFFIFYELKSYSKYQAQQNRVLLLISILFNIYYNISVLFDNLLSITKKIICSENYQNY